MSIYRLVNRVKYNDLMIISELLFGILLFLIFISSDSSTAFGVYRLPYIVGGQSSKHVVKFANLQFNTFGGTACFLALEEAFLTRTLMRLKVCLYTMQWLQPACFLPSPIYVLPFKIGSFA